MKTRLTLISALLFLMMPLILALSERKWAEKLEEERNIDEIHSRATAQLRQMSESTNQTVQLQNLLNVFFHTIVRSYLRTATLNPEWVKAWYRRMLWFILPDHDLVILETSASGTRVIFDNGGPLGFSGQTGKRFLPLMSRGMSIATISFPLDELWRALHFPLLLRDQKDYYHGRIQYFHGIEGARGFFWKSAAHPDARRQLILGITIDTQKLDPLFDLKAMVKGHRSKEAGIGFINLAQGRNFLSSFFSAYPPLRQRLLRARPGAKGFPRFERHGPLLLFSLPPSPGKSHQPLVAFRLPHARGSTRTTTLQFLILLSILVVIGVGIVTERLLFHRGLQLRVGRILLAAFLLSAFIPIIGATVITRQNLLET
ncbi:MAG TPA: hypothetical protein PKO06_21480, partial [Candidatus Ozemobacteraceae bacterium]|nr:hypothetical protein [Candidatus Ozemobacteraceae bacterium]